MSVFNRRFADIGWDISVRIPYGRNTRFWWEIDFAKKGVAVELVFGSLSSLQNNIFVKFPLIMQTNKFRTMIILVFMKGTFDHLFEQCYFERIREQFMEMPPLTLKYPFTILGISDTLSAMIVDELTSDMDQYLIEVVGMSLDEMRLLGEKSQFEYKEVFPGKTREFFHPATAFANQRGGGVFLIGVDKLGNIKGIPKGKPLDDLQLAIKDCIRNNCKPIPKFEIEPFDDPTDASKCVVVVRMYELEHKPCMADDKVYIRVGSATQAAGPDEIRRLLLG